MLWSLNTFCSDILWQLKHAFEPLRLDLLVFVLHIQVTQLHM